jgi:hypothetical protein
MQGTRPRGVSCNSTFSIIYHSQWITLCGASGARGGWHAPCLVARGQRTLSRQGHQTEREREREKEKERGITRVPWPISSHGDVGAGHELHSAAHGQIICSRDRIRPSDARAAFGSAVPPASEPAARARHTASMPASSRQRRSDGGAGESDWESLKRSGSQGEYPRCALFRCLITQTAHLTPVGGDTLRTRPHRSWGPPRFL